VEERGSLAAPIQEPRFGIGMRTGAEFDLRPSVAALDCMKIDFEGYGTLARLNHAALGFLAVRYNKS
jgi:hypothetical protein